MTHSVSRTAFRVDGRLRYLALWALVIGSVLVGCASSSTAQSPADRMDAFDEVRDSVTALDAGRDAGAESATDALVVGMDAPIDTGVSDDVHDESSMDRGTSDAREDDAFETSPDADAGGPGGSDVSCPMPSDVSDCGVCPFGPFSSPTCAAGHCGLRCSAYRADCDEIASNGCEADLSQPEHCGACESPCPAGFLCAWPLGHCVTGCPPGWAFCPGASCADLSTNPNHCGSCSTVCLAPTYGTATCASGACGLMCYSPQ